MSTRAPSNPSRRPKLYAGTACDQCFRTKARCAGEKPQCCRCRKSKTPCTYSTGSRKRQTSEPKVSRPAHSTNISACAPPSPSSLSTTSQHSFQPTQQTDEASSESIVQRKRPTEPTSQPPNLECLQLSEAIGYQTSLPPSDLLSDVGTISIWNDLLPEMSENNQLLDNPPAFVEVNLSPEEPNNRSSELPAAVVEDIQAQPCDDISQQSDKILEPTYTPTSSTAFSDNNHNLGETLARLHAYSLDLSQEAPGEIMEELQRSLSTVCTYITNMEAADKSLFSTLNPSLDASWPAGAAAQQLGPVVAVTCIHTIQLVFACYLKLRKQHRRPVLGQPSSIGLSHPPSHGEADSPIDPAVKHISSSLPCRSSSPSSTPKAEPEYVGAGALEQSCATSLLDYYLARDMRLCQNLAQRLSLWCTGLACSARASPEYQGIQQNEVAGAMEVMISSLKACSLMSI